MDRTLSIRDEFPAPDLSTWRAVVERDLGGKPFDVLTTELLEGLRLRPLYTDADWAAEGDPSGFPGLTPFTRGRTPLGARAWSIVQEHALPRPADNAAGVAADARRGADAVWLRLDPTGQDGIALRDATDLDAALDGADLTRTAVHLDPGASFAPAAALLAAVWAQRGVRPDDARGGFGADPLGALARRGRLPGALEPALAHLGRLGAWAAEAYPHVPAARAAAHPYHDAGATETQDLACAIGTGVEYLRALTAAGLDLEAACAQLELSVSLGPDPFLGIAKLRALRRLWARVTEAAGDAEAAGRTRVHARSAWRMLTARDPWVNLLRATSAGFAAAVGGADAVTLLPYDAALGVPDAAARRLARNTQLVLRDESHLGQVIDPAGGSYLLERLTVSLAAAAWPIFQEIERRGGQGAALRSGWLQEQVADAARRRAEQVARRKAPLTGVSTYPHLSEVLPERTAPATATAVSGAPRPGKPAADDPRAAAEAAEAGDDWVDLGPAWFGEGPATAEALQPKRLSEPFEALRARSDAVLARRGRRPQVFLASLGGPAEHTVRSTWLANLLAAGGIEAVLRDEGYASPQDVADAFRTSGARVAALCSSDRIYAEQAGASAAALREAGASRVLLAGSPGDQEAALRAGGIDDFVHARSDALAFLEQTLSAIESAEVSS